MRTSAVHKTLKRTESQVTHWKKNICKSPQRVDIEDIERTLTNSRIRKKKNLIFFKWAKTVEGHITKDIGTVNKCMKRCPVSSAVTEM